MDAHSPRSILKLYVHDDWYPGNFRMVGHSINISITKTRTGRSVTIHHRLHLDTSANRGLPAIIYGDGRESGYKYDYISLNPDTD